MSKYGIHIPNGPIRDLEGMLRMGFTHYTLLSGEVGHIPALRESSPNGVILVRMYKPRWSELDPITWADECVEFYNQDRGGWSLRSMKADVTPANEMNLYEPEGGGWSYEWYQRINLWCLRWIERVAGRIPETRLHYPAFAYGHSDDDATAGFCGMEVCRQSIERYWWLDVHPYWLVNGEETDVYRGHRFVLAHDLFPDKPIYLSEAGNFGVTRETAPQEFVNWYRSLSEFSYVLGGTPFIWEDPSGAHRDNDWSRNAAIAQAVKEAIMGDSIVIGAGFKKCIPYIGAFKESEVYHWPGTPNETSLAVAERGYAVWRRATNQTICACDDGRVYDDLGNAGDGELVQIHPKV